MGAGGGEAAALVPVTVGWRCPGGAKVPRSAEGGGGEQKTALARSKALRLWTAAPGGRGLHFCVHATAAALRRVINCTASPAWAMRRVESGAM